jgi:D-alanyl-lipoteichoic acid acyltransferase DltB (MBOAT superfamily)
MNFNSPEFAIFFPVVLILYGFVFHRERARDALLLAASYFFYMSWNWMYAALLLLATAWDYSIGRVLAFEQRERVRKTVLVLSLVANLGLLGLFKYFNFFVDTASDVGGLLGLNLSFVHHHLLLPVGISFYTFQSMSYTIDVYRRKIPCEPSFLKFAVFVSFFPQLVAGPIVRAAQFLPQLHRTPLISSERFQSGLLLVFRGLAKKILIADMLAALGVDAVFAAPAEHSSLTLLLALYAYSFQIYNDFSGYSDIAIGAARMLGFDLPENFNRPYLATNVREFWTRWHISLSTWLRDYLYVPLGGNQRSRLLTARNLMITMLLGGLWHGAALNFVLWGAWHGLLLMLSRGQSRSGVEGSWWRVLWARLLCFHLITFSWLLFRGGSVDVLIDYLKGLAAFSGGTVLHPAFFAVLLLAFAVHFTPKDWLDATLRWLIRLPVPVQAAGYAMLLLAFAGLSLEGQPFIYFQF